MKKILLFLMSAGFAFCFDFVVGTHYEQSKLGIEVNSNSRRTSLKDGLGYMAGLDFKDSRIIFSLDKQKSGREERTLTSISCQATSSSEQLTRGFLGIGFGKAKYKNELGLESKEQNAIGLEAGIILDEEGRWLQYLELEVGFKYYTAKPFDRKKSDIEVKDYVLGYIGFNIKV